MSRRMLPLMEYYFAVHDSWFVGPRQVQKVLGHERLTTTGIYLNLTDTHIVDEYAKKWENGLNASPVIPHVIPGIYLFEGLGQKPQLVKFVESRRLGLQPLAQENLR